MTTMLHSNWKHCKTTHAERSWHAHPAGLYDWKPSLEQDVDYSVDWTDHNHRIRKKMTESWIWTVRKEEKKGEENRGSDHMLSGEMFFFIFQGITNWITYRYCMDKRKAPQVSRPLEVIEALHWLGVLLLHCSGPVIYYRGQGQY